MTGARHLNQRVGAVLAFLKLLKEHYESSEEHVEQTKGPVLFISDIVANGREYSPELVRDWSLSYLHNTHGVGLLGYDSELVGVQKGVRQILAERSLVCAEGACLQKAHITAAGLVRKETLIAVQADRKNDELLIALLSLPSSATVQNEARLVPCHCARCVLRSQPDFAAQKSGLEEVYERHNMVHGKSHRPVFLPKFHPELNPIERCWSRMKWHVRRFSGGNLESLATNMTGGLSEEILSITLIRKYVRCVIAYYHAYDQGLDILQADSWIRKFRSHRSFNPSMDEHVLRKVYFPHEISADVPVLDDQEPLLDDSETDPVVEDEEEYWLNVVEEFDTVGKF
jgi:transposase